MNYNKKYIKYKQKYIKFKGGSSTDLLSRINTPGIIKQHCGTCSIHAFCRLIIKFIKNYIDDSSIDDSNDINCSIENFEELLATYNFNELKESLDKCTNETKIKNNILYILFFIIIWTFSIDDNKYKHIYTRIIFNIFKYIIKDFEKLELIDNIRDLKIKELKYVMYYEEEEDPDQDEEEEFNNITFEKKYNILKNLLNYIKDNEHIKIYIKKYIKFLNENNIPLFVKVNIKKDINFITELPNILKIILSNDLYLYLIFPIPLIMNIDNFTKIIDKNKYMENGNYIYQDKRHAVIINNINRDEITIKNSWSNTWSLDGSLTTKDYKLFLNKSKINYTEIYGFIPYSDELYNLNNSDNFIFQICEGKGKIVVDNIKYNGLFEYNIIDGFTYSNFKGIQTNNELLLNNTFYNENDYDNDMLSDNIDSKFDPKDINILNFCKKFKNTDWFNNGIFINNKLEKGIIIIKENNLIKYHLGSFKDELFSGILKVFNLEENIVVIKEISNGIILIN